MNYETGCGFPLQLDETRPRAFGADWPKTTSFVVSGVLPRLLSSLLTGLQATQSDPPLPDCAALRMTPTLCCLVNSQVGILLIFVRLAERNPGQRATRTSPEL